jgi:O-antigen/teichoic acid export membrane protein
MEGGDAGRPSYALSASWTFVSQVAVAVLGLGNVLIVSRSLGPSGRGDVAFLMAVSYLASQLASFSVDQAVTNIAGQSPHQRRAAAGNAVVLSLVLGGLAIAVLGVLLIAFPALGPRVHVGLRVLALAAIPPLILSTYLNGMVFADFGVRVANVSIVIPPVVNVLANGTFATAGALSVASAFSVWVAGQLVALLLLVWYLERRLAGFGRPSKTLARQMLAFGAKAYGGRVFFVGNLRLDQWLVGALAGSRQLGLYSVAVAWSEGLFILPRALMAAQRPYLIRSSPRDAGAESTRILRLSVLLTVPAVLAVIGLAPFLCETIFGAQFRGAINPLRILALGAFGMAAGKIIGSALIAQNRPLLDLLATAVAFVATVVLDVLLIPHHGGLGAAIASSAAYSAGGAAVALCGARVLHFRLTWLYPTAMDVRATGRAGVAALRRVAGRGPSAQEASS